MVASGIALGLLVAYFATPRGGPVVAGITGEPHRTSEADVDLARGVEVESSRRSAIDQPGFLRIEVLNPDGVGEPRVRVVPYVSGRRLERARLIAETNERGLVDVPRLPARRVALTKDDFLPAIVRIDPTQEHVTVRLERSFELTVRAVDVGGHPMKGVTAIASRTKLPFWAPWLAEASGKARPGFDQRTAVFTALTDDHGIARLRGLSRGEFSLTVVGGPFVRLSGHPPRNSVEVPGPPEEVVVLNVFGAAIELTGDEILDARMVFTSASTGISATTLAKRLAQDELESRFERARIFVGVPPSAVQRQGRLSAPAELYVLSRHGGWQRFDISLRKLSNVRVERIDVRPSTLVDKTGRVVVRVTDGTGKAYDGIELGLIHSDDPDRATRRFSLRAGEPARLPTGSYRVIAANRYMTRAIAHGRDFEVRAGTDTPVNVVLSREFRRVRFVVSDLDGAPIHHVDVLTITMQRTHKVMSRFIVAPTNELFCWLPLGEVVQASLYVWGYEVFRTRISLVSPEVPRVVPVRMRPK